MIVILVAFLPVTASCSSGDDDGGDDAGGESTDTTALQAPAFGGAFACTDEVGDQLDGASSAEVPVTQPVPGTDLVDADVELVDDELVVQFTTDGPVTVEDQPRFVVGKGAPQQPATWFEIRAFPKDGAWVVERRRLPTQLETSGAARERIDVVDTPVEVVANTVRFAVPIGELPAIDGTPTWQFGAVARDGAVFDDCNELTS